MRWLLVLACVACDAPAADPDAGPAPVDANVPPEELDAYLEWEMRQGGIPGAAMAIVRGTEIAWIGTYGYADIDAMVAVDESTLFAVASISKTITVVRAMQLVEEGALDLDAPIETYVPYAVRHPGFPDDPITLRLLFTHTSGLADNWLQLAESTTDGDPTETFTEFAEGYVLEGGEHYSPGNWGAEPGTDRDYCNAGFGIVGDAIERAGGASFRDQTRDHVLAPLGMDGAGWWLADLDPAHLAIPYGWNGRFYRPVMHTGMSFYPAGSLRVSIVGLARFLLAIGNGGALEGARVLEQASTDEMLRIQLPDVARYQALSWIERRVNDHLYIGHSGETAGGSSIMLWSREGTHGILLLTNSDAYLRSTFGMNEGQASMDAILARLDREARP